MDHDLMSAVETPLPIQDQYVFIHDAVLESLTCGDTQIPASGLTSAIEKLKQKDRETGRTGFDTQFHVSNPFKCLELVLCDRSKKVVHSHWK